MWINHIGHRQEDQFLLFSESSQIPAKSMLIMKKYGSTLSRNKVEAYSEIATLMSTIQINQSTGKHAMTTHGVINAAHEAKSCHGSAPV